MTILPSCISLYWGYFWSPPPVQCYEPLSIVLQTLCLPDLISWICWSPPLDGGINSSGFLYFLEFKPEFGNEEFMIWATVSSRSCFCWLYRASPSLAAKNIIKLISVLAICWCPCLELSLVLLKEGVSYDQYILLAKLCWPCPASFCTPRPNLSVTPGISSYFCIPVPYDEKDISFWCEF